MSHTTHYRRIFVAALLAVMVISLVAWYVTRDRLPREIVIATGPEGGLYYKLGLELGKAIEQRTGVPVRVDATEGSGENRQRLGRGSDARPDLAIVQAEFVASTQVDVVAPLYPELVHVVVRRESDVQTIHDLAGKSVALGSPGTGMRQTALEILDHYGVEEKSLTHTQDFFTGVLGQEPPLDAAIVTAGYGNPDLQRVLEGDAFRLLPIVDSKALEMKKPFLQHAEIPRGLFAEGPPIPSDRIPTMATPAVLVARKDAPKVLISTALAAIYEDDLALQFPTLIAPAEASSWVPFRMHAVSRSYYNPADRLGFLASVMESLAATKELLFALGAGAYLLWLRWRRLQRREGEDRIKKQKDHLDTLLEQTLKIEREQMRTSDPAKLREYLDAVTRIKLRALQEFTEEELRGDTAFSIFLMQCSSLISRLQLNILVGNDRSE
jgi:TRAP transporter TAXI family solute receptor